MITDLIPIILTMNLALTIIRMSLIDVNGLIPNNFTINSIVTIFLSH